MTTSSFEQVAANLKAKAGMTAAQARAEGAPDAWCGWFIKKGLDKAGLGAVLQGFSNPNYVPTLFKDGETQGLTESTETSTPKVGSLVSERDQSHVMMVSKVNTDGTIEVVEGNYSNKAGIRTLSLKGIDPQFISADKMTDMLQKKGVPIQKDFAPQALAMQSSVASDMAKPDPETGKAPTLTELYDKNAKAAPEGSGAGFLQLIVAVLLMFAGKGDKIPTQEQYRQNANAGVDVLKSVDSERLQQQSPVRVEAVNTTSAPLSTPTKTTASSTELQI